MSQPTKAEARLHVVVSGRVQGVNYRYYAVRAARQLGLTGWVANRWDGTVETVAEGERQALIRYKACLERGSPASIVDRIEASWGEPPSGRFATFRVRHV
jgi:acylphosphatase